MKTKFILNFVVLLAIFTFVSVAHAAEGKGEGVSEQAKSAVKSAIKEHIDAKTASQGGIYVLEDAKKGQMKLKFDYIHEGVNKQENQYVSCVDFIDAQKNAYDVDFFIVEKDGKYSVDKVSVHKEKGPKK